MQFSYQKTSASRIPYVVTQDTELEQDEMEETVASVEFEVLMSVLKLVHCTTTQGITPDASSEAGDQLHRSPAAKARVPTLFRDDDPRLPQDQT